MSMDQTAPSHSINDRGVPADVNHEEITPPEFSFESDQLALKGNSDYQLLLAAIAKLEGLRVKALQDLTKLEEIKVEALADPLGFVQKLQTDKQSLKIPVRSRIPELPKIDWSRYSTNVNIASINKHISTRGRKVIIPEALWKPAKTVPEPEPTPSNVQIVRGRVKDETKPETFNLLWTHEEQRRLEELLTEFPPERVEASRFRKIADRLGSKTYHQVASRIQKYFIRLARSGLPVPGRMPNLQVYKKRQRHRHQRKNHLMSTTFLQSYVPPVFMSEMEVDYGSEAAPSVAGPNSVASDSGSDSDSDEDMLDELKDTDEYRELMALHALRQQRLAADYTEPDVSHDGFKCDGCGQEPISGTRWHCSECPSTRSIDFCSVCHSKAISIEGHKPHHMMLAVKDHTPSGTADTQSIHFNDKDYLPNKFNIPGHYNYLDPNYMPSLNR